jgi:hypothetical protein
MGFWDWAGAIGTGGMSDLAGVTNTGALGYGGGLTGPGGGFLGGLLDPFTGASAQREAAGLARQGIGPANQALYGGQTTAAGLYGMGRAGLMGGRGRMDAARMRALSGLGSLEGVARGSDADILRMRDQASKRLNATAAARGQFKSSFAAKGQGELEAATAAAQQQRMFERLAGIQRMRSGIETGFAGMGQGYDQALSNLYGQQANMSAGVGAQAGQNIMAGHGAYARGMMGAAQATPGFLQQLLGAGAGYAAGRYG